MKIYSHMYDGYMGCRFHISLFPLLGGWFVSFIVCIRTQYNNSCDANVASFLVKAAATVASTGNTVDRLRLAVRTHTHTSKLTFFSQWYNFA